MILIIPVLSVTVIKTEAVRAVSFAEDDVKVLYKKKTCFACHKADASKHFDAAKTDEELIAVVLNGAAGPPKMPEYASKGITPELAAALVAHMRELSAPVE